MTFIYRNHGAAPAYRWYQCAYFAHQLSRRAAPDSIGYMADALPDSQVDLNLQFQIPNDPSIVRISERIQTKS